MPARSRPTHIGPPSLASTMAAGTRLGHADDVGVASFGASSAPNEGGLRENRGQTVEPATLLQQPPFTT